MGFLTNTPLSQVKLGILKNPVVFEFQIKDTIARNNLYINIRNNNDYEFSNLFLITHLNFPDNRKIIDTLEYETPIREDIFRKRTFEKKDNKLFYKENSTFPVSENYQLTIHQAMRRNGDVLGIQELSGITDVGLRIEKLKEK